MKIVVTEYPKSGGNWVVNLIGDALGLPKRDLYDVVRESPGYDLRHHPWYGGQRPTFPDVCVIKSHEPPDSSLINFPRQVVHLVRDGRDVAVSKYFYEAEFCIANGIHQHFDVPFDAYIGQVAGEWREYVTAWLQTSWRTFRYEDFLSDPAGTLRTVLDYLAMTATDAAVEQAVANNTKEKMRASLAPVFKHNTFVRKGIAGDWRNHFSAENARAFTETAGPLLIRLGYENGSKLESPMMQQ